MYEYDKEKPGGFVPQRDLREEEQPPIGQETTSYDAEKDSFGTLPTGADNDSEARIHPAGATSEGSGPSMPANETGTTGGWSSLAGTPGTKGTAGIEASRLDNSYSGNPANASNGSGGYTGGYNSPQQAPTPAPYTQQANGGGYGGYYSGPYYNQNQNGYAYSVPQPVDGGGAPGTATRTREKAPSGGRWVALVAAMLVVALLAGFGGGYLANMRYNSGGSTVVYRSAEGSPTGRSSNVEDMSLSEIAAMAKESVVSIVTENIVTNPFAGGEVQSGAGSGVILSEDGYIITNNHVIDGADNIIVTLPDGTDLPAQLIGTDATSDVAVLKVDAVGLVPAVLGNSGSLLVGDLCLAVGNPMGTLGGTVTDGIISALDREVTIDGNTMNLLQMSAAVSPGNSGGGLFNASGELVGIVNAKSNGEKTEGLGFAIPINTAMQVAEDLINIGYVSGRPALGVSVLYISTAEQALQRGVGELGVYIAELVPGGAAETAGMQVGDKIVSFNGTDIDSTTALTGAIRKCEVGDTVEVVVSRNGERAVYTVTLQELQS